LRCDTGHGARVNPHTKHDGLRLQRIFNDGLAKVNPRSPHVDVVRCAFALIPHLYGDSLRLKRMGTELACGAGSTLLAPIAATGGYERRWKASLQNKRIKGGQALKQTRDSGSKFVSTDLGRDGQKQSCKTRFR